MTDGFTPSSRTIEPSAVPTYAYASAIAAMKPNGKRMDAAVTANPNVLLAEPGAPSQLTPTA